MAPFFDSRDRLNRSPLAGRGGRKDEGIDREGSINHVPLMLSLMRIKLTKLEGLMLGIV